MNGHLGTLARTAAWQIGGRLAPGVGTIKTFGPTAIRTGTFIGNALSTRYATPAAAYLNRSPNAARIFNKTYGVVNKIYPSVTGAFGMH
jgi:hypothetical protein